MQHRVLIVDDEESVLFAVRDFLNRLGCAVDCAADLNAADGLLQHHRYQLVVADLRLAGIHNEEGLKVIEMARELCPDATIVLLTAYGHAGVVEQARRLGANAVMDKPMSLMHLANLAGCASA